MRGLRAFLIVAVLGAGAFALYTYSRSGGDVPLLTSSCTVGLAGAAVSVTVEGPTADPQCESMSGQVIDGGNWYLYDPDTEAGGAVICQYKHQGNTWTVRDQGVANLYGTSVCQNLRAMAAGPTPVPATEPPPTEDVGCVVEQPGDCSVDGGDEFCTLSMDGSSVRIDTYGPPGYCATIKSDLSMVGTFVDVETPEDDQGEIVCAGETGTGGIAVWGTVGAPEAIAVCERFGLEVKPEGG